MRPITIKPALNGYICTVGCQTVVFTSPETLCRELERYLLASDKVECEYVKNAVNPPEPAVPTPTETAEPFFPPNGLVDRPPQTERNPVLRQP